jgi:probable rRNA maturation factor
VLVDDPAMADLNRRWRGGDGVTDVLSFTYLETSGSGAPGLARGEADAACDLWLPPEAGTPDGVPLAGEVILAPAFVAGRCRDEGWDTELEWALLLAHGCLHVLGWEHDTPPQRQAMAEREAEHLGRLGLPHPLRERS